MLKKKISPLHEFTLAPDAFQALRKGKTRTVVVAHSETITAGDKALFRESGTNRTLRRCICRIVANRTTAEISSGHVALELSSSFADFRVYAYGVVVGLVLGACFDSFVRAQFDRDMFSLLWPLTTWAESPPQVTEAESIIQNVAEPGGQWSVCIYNGGSTNNIFWSTAGGDDFRELAALRNTFTHRINARSSAVAARLLGELTAKARAAHAEIKYVAILDHGNKGAQLLGPALAGEEIFVACQRALIHPGSDGLFLLGCKTACGAAGHEYIRLLSRAYGYYVIGSAKIVLVKGKGDGKSIYYPDAWRATPDGAAPTPWH